jgi:hypothetical protein
VTITRPEAVITKFNAVSPVALKRRRRRADCFMEASAQSTAKGVFTHNPSVIASAKTGVSTFMMSVTESLPEFRNCTEPPEGAVGSSTNETFPAVVTPPPKDPLFLLELVKSRLTARAGVAVGDEVMLGVRLGETVDDRLGVTDGVDVSVDVWLGVTDSLGVDDGDENALLEAVEEADTEPVRDGVPEIESDGVEDEDKLAVAEPVTDTDWVTDEDRDGERVPVRDRLDVTDVEMLLDADSEMDIDSELLRLTVLEGEPEKDVLPDSLAETLSVLLLE